MQLISVSDKIADGANTFLFKQYSIMLIFIVAFGIVVFCFVDYLGNTSKNISFYALIAYLGGSLSSILCGYVGMRIAVRTNCKVSYNAIFSLDRAFKVAMQAGCVMGFFAVSFEILGMLIIFVLY